MFFEEVSECVDLGKPPRTFEVESFIIDDLHKYGQIETENLPLLPNQGVVLKNRSQSAVGLADPHAEYIRLAHEVNHFNVKARNKEQLITQNVLDDPDIRCIAITGPAGTGKTHLCAAHALDSVTDQEFHNKLVLSKPLEIVTSSSYWGTLPGDENDKTEAFKKSFDVVFEDIAPNFKGYSMADSSGYSGKEIVEFIPLELMRGMSLSDNIVWFDECQNLSCHEMETLGSRIDDRGHSELIVTGDINQTDKYIRDGDSGLIKMLESRAFLTSPHCAHVHLTQNERGAISQLFYDIFHD